MKLCKDCKHIQLPNQLAAMHAAMTGQTLYCPMCAHPSAERDVVFGNLKTTCDEARGSGAFVGFTNSICRNAELFEQAPLPPPPLRCGHTTRRIQARPFGMRSRAGGVRRHGVSFSEAK